MKSVMSVKSKRVSGAANKRRLPLANITVANGSKAVGGTGNTDFLIPMANNWAKHRKIQELARKFCDARIEFLRRLVSGKQEVWPPGMGQI